MKIRLAVSRERWAELAAALTRAASLQARLENLELSMRQDMNNLSNRIDDNYGMPS